MVRWLFLLILIGVIALRITFYTPDISKYQNGDRLRIYTTITDTPRQKFGNKTVTVSGIQVKIPNDSTLTIGDVVEIIGNVDVQVIDENISIISLDTENITKLDSEKSFRVIMARLRFKVISNLESWLRKDEGALAAGILVGGSDLMSEKSVNSFKATGLTHIVAASGYNVSVVGMWTGAILTGWVNKYLVMYFGILSVILYIFLAGGSAAVVRAGVMYVLVTLGKFLGRETDGLNVLLLGVMGMLLVNPAWWFDIGFQLSVAAMLGMLLFADRSILSQTLACQLTTLPLILHYFGNLSVVAPLANLLFVWPVPIVMPVLALGSLTGYWLPAGGKIITNISFPLLFYMTKGVDLLSSARWAAFSIDRVSWIWVAVYYLTLVLIKLKYFNDVQPKSNYD